MRRAASRPAALLAFPVACLSVACGVAAQRAREADRAHTAGRAAVETVEVVSHPGLTDQAVIRVTGTLPDACTRIDDVERRRFGGTFEVTLRTRRPAGAICAQVVTPFERSIVLDFAGLSRGLYTADVHGVTATLHYTRDPFAPGVGPDDAW